MDCSITFVFVNKRIINSQLILVNTEDWVKYVCLPQRLLPQSTQQNIIIVDSIRSIIGARVSIQGVKPYKKIKEIRTYIVAFYTS